MKNIGAIILAAGQAKRFGSAKQLLKISGETLVDRACRVASESGCRPVIRVLGANAENIVTGTDGLHALTVNNPKWASGMGSSISKGIYALRRFSPSCEALIIMLADQPLISSTMLTSLHENYQETGKTIILSNYGESIGPPALFAKCHFDELATLKGDKGAKVIASNHPDDVSSIAMPSAAWDIDSPERWEAFNRSVAGH